MAKEHEKEKHQSKDEQPEKDATSQSNFACDKCDKTFVDKCGFMKHVAKEHDEESSHSNLACDKCGRTFVNKSGFLKHVAKEHEGETSHSNLVCDKCDKTFGDKCGFLKHVLLEHVEKESDTDKESERVVNMVRSITDKIVENVSTEDVSTEEEDITTATELKRAYSVSPPKNPSKREKRDEPTEKMNQSGNDQLTDELVNIEQGAKLLQENLAVLKEKNNKLEKEAQEREEDIRLLKEDNKHFKKEAQLSKEKIEKTEKDAKEIVVKVSEALRVDIDQKKEEVEGAWKEYEKLKKEQEEKYKVVVEENMKISKEMAKLQDERDLAQAKVESLESIEKAKKYETNLNKFIEEFPAGCSTVTKDDAMDTGEQVDECVKDSKCVGNCKNLELDNLKRLKELKDSGAKRSSPQSETEAKTPTKTSFKCKHCQFYFDNKSELDNHIKTHHKCDCTMCGGTEQNMANVDQHLHERRDQRTRQETKGPCKYHNQQGGCKKGDQCDFDHQSKKLIKIPKICKDGPRCTWKPCCKFIHLEDGDQMPNQRNREMRTPERNLNQKLNQNQRNLRKQSPHHQNFQHTDLSQPPPGVCQKPVGRENLRMWMSPGINLESLKHFPNLSRRKVMEN